MAWGSHRIYGIAIYDGYRAVILSNFKRLVEVIVHGGRLENDYIFNYICIIFNKNNVNDQILYIYMKFINI